MDRFRCFIAPNADYFKTVTLAALPPGGNDDETREVRRSFNTTAVREQHPRSHHWDATDANATGGKGRVRTGDQFYVFAHYYKTSTDKPRNRLYFC